MEKTEIEKSIEAFVRAENYYLFELSIKNINKNPFIQLFVDTETGIDADKLAELNRKLSKMIDENDLITGSYRLDVSSPGIDRPLKYIWQYKRNIGRSMEVSFRDNDSEKIKVGALMNADDERILLETKNEIDVIPYAQIIKAIVQVRFK